MLTPGESINISYKKGQRVTVLSDYQYKTYKD